MHEGCSGSFDNGRQMVDKVRMMGFSEGVLPIPHEIKCECGETFEMEFFESNCPNCNMVYGVTPCSAHDPSKVMPAGIDY
ncbi:hypothetical protein [Haloplasma contractile]|uniref:Uncharacterized protein n=1 Tax=Haloplasma contractile SSD-17B TaxID=1033810 RepID=F7Q1Z9_9MOLU|nr:hypothetical protein [Haloplasma contractile]ERJ12193.1 hypothetical protein HLPCO_001720 [Haloplasma contractile SSD-17B]